MSCCLLALMLACGMREVRYEGLDAISLTVPASADCQSIENRSKRDMTASLTSRDGEIAQFVKCSDSRHGLDITAFRIIRPAEPEPVVRLRDDVAEFGSYTAEPEHSEITLWDRPALREEAEILYAGLPQKRIVVLARDGDVLRGAAVMGTPSVIDKYEVRIDAWLASVEFAR